MPIIPIENPDDPRLAHYRNVPDPELLERAGVFAAEGRLVVRRLLGTTRLTARSVMVTRTALASLGAALVTHPQLPVYVVPPAVMNGVTGFNVHRGCLAMGERPAPRDWRDVTTGARRLVVMEGVGNADNVGAIFRNAAAFGADAVLIGPACADPLYRKSVRTSMGASLTVPFAGMAPWPEALGQLQASGVALVALTPAPPARPLRELLASIGRRPVALLVGHEGNGLTAEALDRSDYRARIPMAAEVDSLNVATAAAIALYELKSLTD